MKVGTSVAAVYEGAMYPATITGVEMTRFVVPGNRNRRADNMLEVQYEDDRKKINVNRAQIYYPFDLGVEERFDEITNDPSRANVVAPGIVCIEFEHPPDHDVAEEHANWAVCRAFYFNTANSTCYADAQMAVPEMAAIWTATMSVGRYDYEYDAAGDNGWVKRRRTE